MNMYDRRGHPIDALAWAELLRDPDYRFLARTLVGPWQVVTAWLGIDQRADPTDPVSPEPLIYGTVAMIETAEGPEGYSADLLDDREFWAANEGAALEHHAEVRTRLRRRPEVLQRLSADELHELVNDLVDQRRDARTLVWAAHHGRTDLAWLPLDKRGGQGALWLADDAAPPDQPW